MLYKVPVGEFFVYRHINRISVHQRLHAIRIVAREKSEEFFDDGISARFVPIIFGQVSCNITACQRFLRKVDDVPRAVDFASVESVTVIPMSDVVKT